MRAAIPFVLFSFILLVFSGWASAELRDGTNIALRPESIRCTSAILPDDFGPIGVQTEFNLRSDCAEWCDFTAATFYTDPANPVSIPICVNTFGRQVNQTRQIKFTVNAQGKEKEFNYGICVSGQEDQDSGAGDPCSVVSLTQKYFEIKMEPVTYIQAGAEGEYEIQVYSPAKLDLEITVAETGKTFSFTTKPQEKMILRDRIKITTDTILNVKAVVKGCSLQGCTKTASTLLTTQEPPAASGNFSVSILPESAISKKGQPVKFYLEIKNYGEEREYSINLTLPQGLKSIFNSTAKSVNSRENIIIEVTPEGSEGLYTFTVSVRGQVEKAIQASLSVNEAAGDLKRISSTQALDSKTINDINSAILKTRDSTVADDLKAFTDFSVRVSNKTESAPQLASEKKPKGKQETGPDMTIILIVVVVVAALVIFLFFKRSRKETASDREEYWEDESR